MIQKKTKEGDLAFCCHWELSRSTSAIPSEVVFALETLHTRFHTLKFTLERIMNCIIELYKIIDSAQISFHIANSGDQGLQRKDQGEW